MSEPNWRQIALVAVAVVLIEAVAQIGVGIVVLAGVGG